jgi:hypothetical protein
MMLFECDHFEAQKREGRRLHHAAKPELQIRQALEMKPAELISWTRVTQSGSLAEEAMVFLIFHHRAGGNAPLVEQLAATLDHKLKAKVSESYFNLIGADASRELSINVASLAWIIMLESPLGRGIWSQLCFRRFVHNLARDVLREMRHSAAVSLDSDGERGVGLEVEGRNVSPEELAYARELLLQLKPCQRQALVLQRGFREPQCAIAKMFGCSARSVRAWLQQAKRKLNSDV